MADKRVQWSRLTIDKNLRQFTREMVAEKPNLYAIPFPCSHSNVRRRKNRYYDVFCLDATRVVLKDRETNQDYIHANWFTMPDGYRYIGTQAPMSVIAQEDMHKTDDTIEDFWHMVATENCCVVVMLCCLKENGYIMCDRYFPRQDDPVLRCGDYTVQYVREESDVDVGVNVDVYDLHHNGLTRKITHYQCTIWNDLAAPLNATALVKLLRQARAIAKESPVVVHCSSGLGRTPTFIAIEYAVQKLEIDNNFSMLDVVRDMWNMSYHAIQSSARYAFLNWAVMEYFVQEGILNGNSRYYQSFEKTYKRQMISTILRVLYEENGTPIRSYTAKLPKKKTEKKSSQNAEMCH